MRRLQLEASMVVLWLLASGVIGYASDSSKAASSGTATPQTETNKDKVFSRVVLGWGETVEDAQLDAQKRAWGEIVEFYADQGVILSWKPSVEYIKNSLVKEFDKEGPKEMKGLGKIYEVRLRVDLSRKNHREILRWNREHAAQDRMILLGKVLACLVALLAAVAGYFRLEDATKGYYTAWLRLAALGFVTAVGAGLWLIS